MPCTSVKIMHENRLVRRMQKPINKHVYYFSYTYWNHNPQRQLDIFKERHCWEEGYKGSCKNEIKYSTFDNTGREEPEHVDFFS